MKRLNQITLLPVFLCCMALTGNAQTDTVIVNDTWSDGNRTSAGPNGISGIDSTWYASSSGANTVPSAGDMRWVIPAGSLFNTTYFPSATSPFGNQAVTLVNPGDTLAVTWTFALTGVSANNVNQNFLVAIANTPGAHLTTQASPAQEAYTGYSTFINMSGTLNNASPFALKEWVNGATATSLLGTSAAWGANGVSGANLALDGTSGNTGFENTTYTYFMSMTLGLSGDLLITNSMTGGTLLNGVGNETIVYDDTTPNSLTFDTFGVREGTSSATASQFDTSLFRVDFHSAGTAPEPTTLALSALGILALAGYRRMSK